MRAKLSFAGRPSLLRKNASENVVEVLMGENKFCAASVGFSSWFMIMGYEPWNKIVATTP
jgi:hypothetical protein